MLLTSVPKSDIYTVIQFPTIENILGHCIQRYLCVAYKNLIIVTKSASLMLSNYIEHFVDKFLVELPSTELRWYGFEGHDHAPPLASPKWWMMVDTTAWFINHITPLIEFIH